MRKINCHELVGISNKYNGSSLNTNLKCLVTHGK